MCTKTPLVKALSTTELHVADSREKRWQSDEYCLLMAKSAIPFSNLGALCSVEKKTTFRLYHRFRQEIV